MRPNVDKAGMARLAASARRARLAAGAALLALLTFPATAGDRAQIDYLGYSPDGRYFAFEEFGEQDGSGFPFANLYIIDLQEDAWVGAPYRALLQEDGARVVTARYQVWEEAQPKLDELMIGDAVQTIALNGDGDPGSDVGHSIVFGQPGYGLSAVPDPHILQLETFPLESAAECAVIDDETFGFALILDNEEIYRDSGKLPESRSCSMGYKIYAVVRPPDWSLASGGMVAIISNYPYGFEGPDRRFLAVPLPLP